MQWKIRFNLRFNVFHFSFIIFLHDISTEGGNHGELNPQSSETAGYLDQEQSIVYFHILTLSLVSWQLVCSTSIIRNICVRYFSNLYEISCTQSPVRNSYKLFALYSTDYSSCRLVHHGTVVFFSTTDKQFFKITNRHILTISQYSKTVPMNK